jgi:CubicO group peptidase (beta-lactamase class C family)
MPPVSAADLQSVLDKDLADALKTGQLAPSTGAGVSIAVIDHGVRRVFSYGTAKPDSIFEIGSITKTFTGLILSQMVKQGKVKFDDPVRDLLPPGTVAKPAGAEITLLDLATQHSGLPRMPDNFHPADPQESIRRLHRSRSLRIPGQTNRRQACRRRLSLLEPRLRSSRPGARQSRRRALSRASQI